MLRTPGAVEIENTGDGGGGALSPSCGVVREAMYGRKVTGLAGQPPPLHAARTNLVMHAGSHQSSKILGACGVTVLTVRQRRSPDGGASNPGPRKTPGVVERSYGKNTQTHLYSYSVLHHAASQYGRYCTVLYHCSQSAKLVIGLVYETWCSDGAPVMKIPRPAITALCSLPLHEDWPQPLWPTRPPTYHTRRGCEVRGARCELSRPRSHGYKQETIA